MNRFPIILIALAKMMVVPVLGQSTNGFNPDPGASLKPIQAPFYQMPPGASPDYALPRDLLLDQPHAPLLDIHTVTKHWNNRDYSGAPLPPYTVGVPDRWYMNIPGLDIQNIPVWMRYNSPEPETPYMYNTPRLWDPYKQSVLKGDVPIAGQDIFLSLGASSFTSYEATDLPTPSGVSSANANNPQFFGQGDQREIDQFCSFSIDLFKGETVFQPVTWLLHLQPVYNVNYVRVKETGILSVDPRGSSAQSDNNGVFTNNSGNGAVTTNGSAGASNSGGTSSYSSALTSPGSVLPGNPGALLRGGPVFASSTPVAAVSGGSVLASSTPVAAASSGSVSSSGSSSSLPSTASTASSASMASMASGGTGFDYVGPSQLGSKYVTRTKDFISLQEAFLEINLADFSDNYDFISMRVGNQPFISDFRGFVFNDTNLGVRIFGNAESNRWQYNLAAFDMREKDTYSQLNTFDSRHQYVFVANLYRQDFFAKGYTAQLSFLANLDNAFTHYDRTGNLVDPEPLGGPIVPHNVRAYYFGANGDGHVGRVNLTHSFYEVIGKDAMNGLAGQSVDINAQMGAVELSYDQDWIRYKASFFYGSGDNNAQDSHATGFDSILDNPTFAGGPFSYFVRQGFVFGDTDVNFKQSNSLLLDLRSSKTEGQANFVNPGVFLYGVGTDMDLLPTLKLFLNANYIRMADVEPVAFALHAANITPEIGWDLSAGVQFRPLLTNNIFVSAGLGALIPGNGYKTIYGSNTVSIPGYDSTPPNHVDSFLYSGFASITLTF